MKILIYLLAFILLSVSVSAWVYNDPICYPDGIQICNKPVYCSQNPTFPGCSGDPNGIMCDVLDRDVCTYMCSNGACNSDPTNRICTEGWEQCGLTDTYDPLGDAYKCVNGQWQLKYDCNPPSSVCKETAYNFAQCQSSTTWYCLKPNNYECYTSSNQQTNCYTTETECKQRTVWICQDNIKKTCVKRFGTCLPGELSHSGTDLTAVDQQCRDALIRDEQKTRCSDGDYVQQFACILSNALGTVAGSFFTGLFSGLGPFGTLILFIVLFVILLYFISPFLMVLLRLFK